MATLWRSILLAQPNDGDTVFIRRGAQDPPVRAVWSGFTSVFALETIVDLTVVGGDFAGLYSAVFTPDFGRIGVPGWFVKVGGIWLVSRMVTAPNWTLDQTDLVANAYEGDDYAPPPGPATTTMFTTVGSPSWIGPSSMTLGATPAAVITIPAWGISAWRPLVP